MRRNNFEDATAKALDLLPHDDPARSDPRLVRDAKCLEEIRATQEAAADIWLATTPLRAAPPEVLSSIMSKVEARTPLARRNAKFFPWLAASGWVAAAITFLLWPRDGEKSSPVARVDPPAFLAPQERPEVVIKSGAPPENRIVRSDRRTREELQRLKAQMIQLDEQGAFSAPRVLGLHSPDSLQPAPGDLQRRVVTALADALDSLLELESGAPGDPARLVLQRGWLPDTFELAENELIRHLNFPLNAVQDYGLTVSAEGAYYDQTKDIIWTRDEKGRGFLGRRATDEDDLSAFQMPDDETLAAATVVPRTQPEGFVIEDPETNSAQVLIDQVPPPAAGFEQVVIWTDAAGNEGQIKVESPSEQSSKVTIKGATASAEARIPLLPSVAQAGACRLFFSLPDSGGVKSFRLVELPTVANGSPPKVIVAGERRSRGPKLR